MSIDIILIITILLLFVFRTLSYIFNIVDTKKEIITNLLLYIVNSNNTKYY